MSEESRQVAKKRPVKGQKHSQDKARKSDKTRWFNYMKDDELAPEETRDIAFLGYN